MIYLSPYRVVVNKIPYEGSTVAVFNQTEWFHMRDFVASKPAVGDRFECKRIRGKLLYRDTVIVEATGGIVEIAVSDLQAGA